MKTNFRFFSWLCTAIISLLGFAACDGEKEILYEYGSPTADYKYMGTVIDEHGNPIKGINVVFQGSRNSLHKEFHRVVTDENGRYSTDYIHWNTGGIYQALYTDVDGEENGGHFEDKTHLIIDMEKEQTDKGNGWYQGKFIISNEVSLKKKSAEETNEQPENEGNNE